MAVPPTIPTSFVPKQPVDMRPRRLSAGWNLFTIASLIILGAAIVLSVGIFAYGRYLSAQADQKAAEIEAKQKGVSQDVVEEYIRLSDRLRSAETILSQHVMLSQFFDVLESLTLKTVRFTSLSLSVAADESAEVKMSGIAENFNALAAQSASFAAEPRIKQAIFSGISADKNGVVSFSVTAKLDPRLVEIPSTIPAAWNTVPSAPPPVATTTATSSPPTTP